MSRRRRSEAEVPVPGDRKSPRVRVVRREGARSLAVLRPGDSEWERDDDLAIFCLSIGGALVKVQPPAGATPERVEAVRSALVEAGALAVRVLPPERRAEQPAAEPVRPVARRSVRQVVEEAAARVPSQDRAALDAVLDAAMGAEGL